jgi:hypothetical protein
MESESEQIHCPQHGPTGATFICQHLFESPAQRWYCGYPTEDSPRPDAWCARCDVEWKKQGEWNEANEGFAAIRLICGHCYDEYKARSLESVDDATVERWESFREECCSALQRKQELLIDEFRLEDHERWDWDQESGELVFSNDGVPAVVARIAFVGSLSTRSDTWLWAWANFSLLEPVRNAVPAVRRYGEEHGFPWLTVPLWPADIGDAWSMAAIATHVLEARGVHRTSNQNGFTFMVLQDVREAP